MAAMPEAKHTAGPPSRSPRSSSRASQPAVPSSRAYSRPEPARKVDAGTIGTLSGVPGPEPRPSPANRVSTRRSVLSCCTVTSAR